ncbi:MAG: hypothetical protein V9G12_11400 [Microthrixaceae bacterium]
MVVPGEFGPLNLNHPGKQWAPKIVGKGDVVSRGGRPRPPGRI